MSEKEIFVETMRKRTKQFVLNVIKLYQSFPKSGEYYTIGNQLLRSASSTGSNYRAVCRARSDKEFYSKISIVLEEADESAFWLEILIESNLKNDDQTKELLKESIELTKIFSKTRSSIGDKIKNNKIN